MEMIYVSILYTIGHIIEGYILAPKIIGDRIGLHPVWIIFSAVTTANLFGLVGIFFAIPIAGIVKVCIIYILDYYRSSGIYKY
jgi:putative permease